MTQTQPGELVRTIVVDDDFRVARIHAASVERVEGFVCVGEARTAADARALIAEVQPDLMLLDIFLPDQNGLDLYRSLVATGAAPDCIFVSAARDVEAVRTAIGLGAVYYLVKPFGLEQLRNTLVDYRAWRAELARAATQDAADQSVVDALYAGRRSGGGNQHASLPPTMAKILQLAQSTSEATTANSVADSLGISRPTAQKYLSELHRRGHLELELAYGQTGRPVNRYRFARRL